MTQVLRLTGRTKTFARKVSSISTKVQEVAYSTFWFLVTEARRFLRQRGVVLNDERRSRFELLNNFLWF